MCEWQKLVALKNVTINEEYFIDHFPQASIMPGVLVIEAMVQAAMIFLNLSDVINYADKKNPDIYYLYFVKTRFLHMIKPGDQLIIEVTPVKVTLNSGMLKTVTKVDGKEIARAEIIGAQCK